VYLGINKYKLNMTNSYLPKELIVIILKYADMNDLINTQILTKNKNNNIFNLSLSLENLSKGYNFCCAQKLLLETELSIYCQNIHIKSIMNKNIKNISLFELKHIFELNKYNLEYENNCKERPIHFICEYQDYNTIKYVLENYKINLECENKTKQRPIYSICAYQDFDTIKYILENYKINLECFNNLGWSFFHFICYYRNKETIQYIYDNFISNMNINSIKNIMNNKMMIVDHICYKKMDIMDILVSRKIILSLKC
jgi:hypothetical protein